MKKNLLWLLVPCIMLIAALPATAQNIQLIQNNGFETWTAGPTVAPDHWSNVIDDTIEATQEAVNVHGGTYSANLTWISPTQANCDFLSDPIPVVGGAAYACSLWALDNDAAGRVTISLRFSNGTNYYPTNLYTVDSPTWQQIGFAGYVAPMAATTVRVGIRCYDVAATWDGNCTNYVDDVTLWGPEVTGNIPPSVTSVYSHPYPVCYPTDIATASATIIDADGTIAKDSLYYRINSGTWNAVGHDSIASTNPNMYWYTIGSNPGNTIVEYNAMAIDDDGARSQSSTFSYTVTPTFVPHVPIYALQHTTNAGTIPACYPTDSIGTTQTISGIVVGVYANNTRRCFVQDAATPWSGVYAYNIPVGQVAVVGDSVTVTGVITEFNAETELGTISSYTIENSGHALFAPVVRTSAEISYDTCSEVTEPYEGMLVQLNNVTIDSAYTFGAVWAHDASGEACIIDDDLFVGGSNPPTIVVGNTYTYIRGICRYTYSQYKVMPRFADDVYTAPLECTGSTIYNVEFNNSNPGVDPDCYPSPQVNQNVSICGIVTAVGQNQYKSFYIQDQGNTAYGGIYCFDFTLPYPGGDTVRVQVGDYVQVNGYINEYNGWTELDSIQSYTILGSGVALPDTVDLTVSTFTSLGACSFYSEPYESELVRFVNVTVRSGSPSSGKYWITDTSTGDSIRIDDDLWIGGSDMPSPAPNTGFVYDYIVGVIRYEGRQDANNTRGWILMPRYASDYHIGVVPEPNITAVWPIDRNTLAVTFDRAMNSSIGVAGNYSTQSGLLITGAAVDPTNNRKAILNTAVQPDNVIDSLIVTGVCDSVGNVCMTLAHKKLFHSGITPVSVIQTPNARGDSSMWVNHIFTTEGVLESDSLTGHYSNSFLRGLGEPPYNGIHLYIGGIDPRPFIGDTVIVTGLCIEYQFETELSDLSVYKNCRIIGHGAAPVPVQATVPELKAHGEYYESDLVTVCDSFQVVNTAFDAKGWLITSLTNPSDSIIVYKDGHWTDMVTYVPVVGDRIRGITGIFRFAWNFFRVSPRNNADLNTSATYCEVTPPTCQYVVGDDNGSGTWTGQDVTYGVRFFKGGNPPPYRCECTAGHEWYVAGDVNGSCSFTGQDVTRMVLHFKSGVVGIPCPDCPPGAGLLLAPSLKPSVSSTVKTSGAAQ